MASLPIIFREELQLGQLGIPADSIGFATLTMGSQKYICIRDITQPDKYVIIVDLENPSKLVKEKITADSAIMNPSRNVLALKASNTLQVFDMGKREKLNETNLTEPVEFWKWIDNDNLVLVSASSVYQWELTGKPTKIFARLNELNGSQIINYRIDPTKKWAVLIGISKVGERIVGNMQLYSFERKMSQHIPGHSASFIRFPLGGEERTLFCFASRTAEYARMFILEVGTETKFERKQTDIFFPPEAAQDFPVAMESSSKYKVVYMITKFGYIHIFDIGTGKLIYMNRISAETIFVTAPKEAEGGVLGVNRKGQLLSVSIDPRTVIHYITSELKDFDLAMRFAAINGLPGAEDLFATQFHQLISMGNAKEAAEVAAISPNGFLRTLQTIQRFQTLPATGGQSPLLVYFTVLLEKGKLNKIESMELVKPVLQQGRKEILETWLKEDKLECSEELGDLVRAFDSVVALSIYYRAGAKDKVVACLAESGQLDKISEFVERASFLPNYFTIIGDMVQRGNTQAAFNTAMKVYNTSQTKNVEDLSRVVDLFMSRGMLQETTSLLYDALKGDRPEEAILQTKCLEYNLMQAPQVAEAILKGDMYHHYDKKRIAVLCEKAGLLHRALENYDNNNDRRRVLLSAHAIPNEFLVKWFGSINPDEALPMLQEILRSNRANLPKVVAVAAQHSAKFGERKLIELFEAFSAFDGLYQYLSSIVEYSQDPEVHFKFIEAATKVGALPDVERICRESKVYEPDRVRDFLMRARLPDQLPVIIVCDTHGFIEQLTKYLFDNSMTQYIDAYVQKINPMNTPRVVGALLDADCNEEYIRKLVLSVGNMAPVDPLVAEVEKRNRLRLLQPWLEGLVNQGNTEPATHNALAKIYITEASNDPEQFLLTDAYYEPRVVGKFCENRDPNLAFLAYKRGKLDEELVKVTNKHGLFKNQARYLVERQSFELWALVLREDNEFRKPVLDEVVATALPESKNPEEVSTTVKALMNADMPKQLIELLEKIVIEGSEFRANKNLQNLLILTAIKAEPKKVMDYVNQLEHYDGDDIAEIAVNNKLYEEAFQIFKKFEINDKAIVVLIERLNQLDRAVEFAQICKQPKVWSILAEGQLAMGKVADSIASYLKADDPGNYVEVIRAAHELDLWEDLVKYLRMCRLHAKQVDIESELVYALAKTNALQELEEFLTGSTIAQIQNIGDRCFEDGMYAAARLLFNNINNFAKLASTLVKLQDYPAAVEAARRAKSTRTWKEINRHLISLKEFRLAQLCALHIIVHGDELDALIREYEFRGHFDEIIQVLDAGLAKDQAHNGMFTELAILYSKYGPDKLMHHLTMYHARINTQKVIRTCNQNQQWPEVAYLYEVTGDFDNAADTVIAHPVSAWEHAKFKTIVVKANKTDVLYRAVRFYLAEHPAQVTDLLLTLIKRVDPERVVKIAREMRLLPLIQKYLITVQDQNLLGVNEALNELYVEEEDFDGLRKSINAHDNFDPLTLAKKLRDLKSLELRRIAAYLYRENAQYAESIELSKQDKLYKDAMETAAQSAKSDIAESLLRFFVKENLFECFSACLYTCYDFIKPDVAMELAWKSGQMNLAMPFMIQVVREYTSVVDQYRADKKAEAERKEKEKNAAMGGTGGPPLEVVYTGMGPPGSGPILMVPTGGPMGFATGMTPVVTGFNAFPPTGSGSTGAPVIGIPPTFVSNSSFSS